MTVRPVIAVVDDEASVRKALIRLLNSSGFEAREFASGLEFLSTLHTCHYDCLILDLHMPVMSGQEMQHDDRFLRARLPTVIITAHDEGDLRQKNMPVSEFSCLRKPFEDDVLLDAVTGAMNHQ